MLVEEPAMKVRGRDARSAAALKAWVTRRKPQSYLRGHSAISCASSRHVGRHEPS